MIVLPFLTADAGVLEVSIPVRGLPHAWTHRVCSVYVDHNRLKMYMWNDLGDVAVSTNGREDLFAEPHTTHTDDCHLVLIIPL